MPYPLLTESATFTLGDKQSSKRGQQFQAICSETPLFQLTAIDQPYYCPFGASVFKGDGTETRLNLDVRLDERSTALFAALDAKFQGLIGKQDSKYHPMVHNDGEYGSRLHIKVSTTGPQAGILWTPEKKRLGTVTDFDTRGASIIPVVGFSKVWYMGGMHGITLELRHAIVAQAPGDEADFDWPMTAEPADPF